MTTIYIIPDRQIRPDVDTSYNKLLAKHISEEKPDYIVDMGDFWDMKSLSYYDKGKKSHEVFNFIEDIESGNDADREFFAYLKDFWPRYKSKTKRYRLKGNHEDRIRKAFDYGDSNLRELIRRFKCDNSNWDKVIPFLKPVKIEGVYFCHYFPNDNSGKPITSARALLNKRHCSCIAGHQQGFDYAEQLSINGKVIQAIIAGSCYTHDEEYKGPNNHHFRGVVILRNVKNGMFDFSRVSLESLQKKYGKKGSK